MPRKKKLIIAQVPKSEMEEDSKIASLQALQVHPGWIVMMGIMKESLDYVESQILDEMDRETGEDLNADDIERLRMIRKSTKEFMNTPQNYIKSMRGDDITEQADPDPFYKNGDEIRKAKRGL